MSVETLVNADGRLNSAAFSSVPSESDEAVSVVSIFSVHNNGQRKLLDDLFQTSFLNSSDLGISAATILGDDSAAFAEPPHHVVVLSSEPYDGPDRLREEARENVSHLSLVLSDVVVFVVRLNELTRVNTNGLSAMRASLTQLLLLQSDQIAPTPSGKRAFLVVVKDYEADVVAREEIIAGFLQEAHELYNDVARPPGSPSRITDLFEFEFSLLPSQLLEADIYQTEIEKLRLRLLDPASDDYLFENAKFSRPATASLAEIAGNAWKKLNAEAIGDIPPTDDLMSAFDCDNAMRTVLERYHRGVRGWRQDTDGGQIIENFGEAATDMVKKTISVYEQDASPHKSSKAFKRKKEELRSLLDAELYNLFVVQMAKLREMSYGAFKDKLSGIPESDPRLERAVKTALRDSEKEFRKNAEALKPKFASWCYDNDVKELAVQMREDATERLQQARLADYQQYGMRRGRRRRPDVHSFGTKKRQPINVSFHYLDPAPFGWKDSRYEKLSVDDDIQYAGNRSEALVAPKGSGFDGLAVPIAPTDSTWHKRNQEFIYTERK